MMMMICMVFVTEDVCEFVVLYDNIYYYKVFR